MHKSALASSKRTKLKLFRGRFLWKRVTENCGFTKNGGNYSTTNSASVDVWPSSGTWTFQNGDKNKLLRSDNVVLSISLTSTTLRTSFTVSGGLKEGNWVFDFIKQ